MLQRCLGNSEVWGGAIWQKFLGGLCVSVAWRKFGAIEPRCFALGLEGRGDENYR